MMERVLVTGGAGLIGSHTVDALLAKGYRVRILDALRAPTHLDGQVPDWVPDEAEFIRGDVGHRPTIDAALEGVDSVIHLAATVGFTPDIAHYFRANTVGTATLLEAIRARPRPLRRLVIASSVGIYGEGRYRTAGGEIVDGELRPVAQLEAGHWEPLGPDGAPMTPTPTDERKRADPANPYCISKLDQEQLALTFGRADGLEVVALRYFLTYGPRQSASNPYTGVIAIFANRIQHGLPPMVFEDGAQTRDFLHVSDAAAATVLALEHPQAAGHALNVGTGVGTAIEQVAQRVAEHLGRPDLRPEIRGTYRALDVRHLVGDSAAMHALGWAPEVTFEEGLAGAVDWFKHQGPAEESSRGALGGLRHFGIVRGGDASEVQSPAEDATLSIVVPVYDEAGNIERMVRDCLRHVPAFARAVEVIVVNDGSRDETRDLVDRLCREDDRVRAIHHPFNLGYGAAQKSGFLVAQYDWVALVPGDNQFDIRDLARYLAVRHDVDVIGGVRQGRKETWDRRWASGLFNRYIRASHGVTLTDINWVKVYRRSLLSQVTIETPGFSADAEVLVKLAALGARMTELAVEHLPRTWGEETHVTLRNVTHTAMELVSLPGKLRRLKPRGGTER
jgi:dTDP-L-rhamnose 4-epimerase